MPDGIPFGQIIDQKHSQRVDGLLLSERAQKKSGLHIVEKGTDFNLRKPLLEALGESAQIGAIHEHLGDVIGLDGQ